ncbi:MAG TPA: peptidyl-prolyl cis-trans isomerase [Anaerolineae bacterium]|nr:peptidyl-prolyl cis-trans isomerase [Anaerolineae bacterium]
MAEGWKQLIEDLRGALGLPARARPDSGAQAEAYRSSASPQVEHSLTEAPVDGVNSIHLPAVSTEQAPPVPQDESAPEAKTLTPRQRLVSYAGVAVTLLAAIGIGWYVYFGGPQSPAPNVVVTFDGGQITVEQVHEHMTRLGLDPLAHPTQEGQEAAPALAYESYRITVEHMILDELVRRWAAGQQADRDTKFTDAMRHVSESVTLEEWIAEIHQDEMTAAVRESDIQAYYDTNRESFGNATLTEVRETIRETLAHQNQQQFLTDYVTNLRANATIVREYELLEAPAPSEAQIRQDYETNRSQFATPKRARVDRISVPVAGSGEEAEAKARGKAEAALAALKTGKDFAAVAAEYSAEPYTPAGVTLEAGQGDPVLVEQAFALTSEGALSPVFRAEAGYVVLRLREQQPAHTLTLDEARQQIVAALRAENETAWFEQNADRALFTLSGERYTLGQFYHEYQNLPPEFQAQYAGPEGLRQLADGLIERLLVLDDAYNRLIDQKNSPLLEDIRAVILRQMMHQSEVDTQVKVTDDAVRAYYDQHREVFATPPDARIRAIRIYLGQTADETNRAWTRAEEAYQKLAPGLGSQPADFEAVAQEYDETEKDPAGAGLGEWIRMADDAVLGLPAHPLHDFILNLRTGDVSQPFAFGDSLYIVKMLERTEPAPLAFEQVQDFIRAELEAQQHQQIDTELTTRQMREANVTIYDQVIAQMVETDRATPVAPLR